MRLPRTVVRRSGVELLVSSFRFHVSCCQETTSENLELETCNLKRLNETRFTDSVAEVVKWQTRTFEGRVAQAVRVQVPPSAPTFSN